MASLRKRGRNWYYAFIDGDGRRVERKGCPDKRVTESMAAHAEAEAARVRAGLSDSRAEARRRQTARPLSEHLADWHTHLIAEGHTHKHAGMSLERARRVTALVMGSPLAEIAPPRRTKRAERERFAARLETAVGSARLADLTRDRVQAALATLRGAGLSLQSLNHHRAACRAFSRWAWRNGRTSEDALVALTGYNAEEDRRHDRRTLGIDELRRLIDAAYNGPIYRKMTGLARALCYRLAATTGLRFSEIASVIPESFALAGERPTVTVRAAYTKNGETATLPLPGELAADLATYIAEVPTGEQVFPLPEKGAAMLRIDLKAAGIPYRDAGGLVFDFHALRCECATLADQAGVTPRVVQKLMRHSTLELTGPLHSTRSVDLERAADALPSLRPDARTTEPAAATGTDGQPIGDRFAAPLPHAVDVSGRELTVADGMTPSGAETSMDRKSLEMTELGVEGRSLTATGGSTPERVRTSNLRFRRPMLYPVELRVRGSGLVGRPVRLIVSRIAAW
jgi:integrase